MDDNEITLDRLWDSTPPAEESFNPENYGHLPEPVQRYLSHSIAPVTPLAASVRLKMHGEIKLSRWLSFQAEQVIRWDRGMIWKAAVKMAGLPVKGFDRVIGGRGRMKWKFLGLFPIVNEDGPDISRSSKGRMAAEAAWLPSVFTRPEIKWNTLDSSRSQAEFDMFGEKVEPLLTIAPDGRLQSIQLKRWGNPGNGKFRYQNFGGLAEAERTFSGYTIPASLRIGWHFENGRFESEGEFFRVFVDEARFL